MLRQAENDVLTMRFADTGPISLEAKAYNGGTLVLDGAGQIDLSDNVDNVVQLADDAQLQMSVAVPGTTPFRPETVAPCLTVVRARMC